tara:strand:+ start:82 stop:495 length:414 start_codon:yes stop_codon:yes gene_type:complete
MSNKHLDVRTKVKLMKLSEDELTIRIPLDYLTNHLYEEEMISGTHDDTVSKEILSETYIYGDILLDKIIEILEQHRLRILGGAVPLKTWIKSKSELMEIPYPFPEESNQSVDEAVTSTDSPQVQDEEKKKEEEIITV